jgi:hypothetical protein
VVGNSLVELLARALDSGGSTELPVLGMLAQELEPLETMSRLSFPLGRNSRK